MASAAEQLASNFNFGAFNKATELKKRIWFTLGALVIYRLGTYIPLPGIDPQVIRDIFDQGAGGITDMMDLFTGGALGRMSIFALNIMPYISASIIIQLMTTVSPHLAIIAPSACLAILPVSKLIFLPLIWISSFAILNIISLNSVA